MEKAVFVTLLFQPGENKMPNNVSDKIQLNFDYIHGGITCIEKGYDSEMRKYPF